MTDKDIFVERERALEDDYFRRRDLELIEKMRQQAAAERERSELRRMTGLYEPEMLEQLRTLGFTPETIVLLPLMPALQVAWADRAIQPGERDLILKFARARGVAEGSAADRQLAEWLDQEPPSHVFLHATRLIRAILDTAPEKIELTAGDIVRQAEAIADAAGGVFGVLRRISLEEKQILEELSQALNN